MKWNTWRYLLIIYHSTFIILNLWKIYVLWHGSRCFRRLYPGLQRHEDTPSSVRHLSCCIASHVESSPTMQVSILTGGLVGRFQAGTDGLALPGCDPGGPGGPPCGCNTWLTEYDLKSTTRRWWWWWWWCMKLISSRWVDVHVVQKLKFLNMVLQGLNSVLVIGCFIVNCNVRVS